MCNTVWNTPWSCNAFALEEENVNLKGIGIFHVWIALHSRLSAVNARRTCVFASCGKHNERVWVLIFHEDAALKIQFLSFYALGQRWSQPMNNLSYADSSIHAFGPQFLLVVSWVVSTQIWVTSCSLHRPSCHKVTSKHILKASQLRFKKSLRL